MTDINHMFGSDLEIGSNGQFILAADAEEGQQRVLRRLLTNPHDYPWHLEYGAGLSRFIGKTMNRQAIASTITTQMRLERAVVRIPPPVVNVSASTDNTVVAHIKYVDQSTQQVSVLDFSTE